MMKHLIILLTTLIHQIAIVATPSVPQGTDAIDFIFTYAPASVRSIILKHCKQKEVLNTWQLCTQLTTTEGTIALSADNNALQKKENGTTYCYQLCETAPKDTLPTHYNNNTIIAVSLNKKFYITFDEKHDQLILVNTSNSQETNLIGTHAQFSANSELVVTHNNATPEERNNTVECTTYTTTTGEQIGHQHIYDTDIMIAPDGGHLIYTQYHYNTLKKWCSTQSFFKAFPLELDSRLSFSYCGNYLLCLDSKKPLPPIPTRALLAYDLRKYNPRDITTKPASLATITLKEKDYTFDSPLHDPHFIDNSSAICLGAPVGNETPCWIATLDQPSTTSVKIHKESLCTCCQHLNPIAAVSNPYYHLLLEAYKTLNKQEDEYTITTRAIDIITMRIALIAEIQPEKNSLNVNIELLQQLQQEEKKLKPLLEKAREQYAHIQKKYNEELITNLYAADNNRIVATFHGARIQLLPKKPHESPATMPHEYTTAITHVGNSANVYRNNLCLHQAIFKTMITRYNIECKKLPQKDALLLLNNKIISSFALAEQKELNRSIRAMSLPPLADSAIEGHPQLDRQYAHPY